MFHRQRPVLARGASGLRSLQIGVVAMLDSLTQNEVTEEPQLLKLASPDRAPIKPHPSRQATHWTRRLPDIVGGALQKLVQPSISDDALKAASSSSTRKPRSDNPSAGDAGMLLQALSESSQAPISAPVSDTLPELDRRGFPRRASECSVTVIDRRETDPLTPHEVDLWLQTGGHVGKLLDISQTGLCLQLNREVLPDSELILRITNQQLNSHVDTVARVVHSRTIGQGRYTIHCRVQAPFTRAQLQDLGRPPVAAGHVLA